MSNIFQITFSFGEDIAGQRLRRLYSVFWQKTSKCKAICEETENSKDITHSLGALDDSCFMAFPMRQDSMWVSSVWCSHCIPASGGPPTWIQWWSKYCCMATSPSRAHRVNCGRTAGLCYLSLPPDHGAEAWDDHANASPCCESPTLPSLSWSGSQLIVVNVFGLGWTWQALTSFKPKTNRLRPSGAEGKARPRGNEVPKDALVTGWRPWFFFPLMQDIRQSFIIGGYHMFRLLKQVATPFK